MKYLNEQERTDLIHKIEVSIRKSITSQQPNREKIQEWSKIFKAISGRLDYMRYWEQEAAKAAALEEMQRLEWDLWYQENGS